MGDLPIHLDLAGPQNYDRVLAARVNALHAAVREANEILRQAVPSGHTIGREVVATSRREVLARAAELEEWLLRPLGQP